MSVRFVTIDALRGFAALWVFAYHLWNVYCPGCSAQVEPIPIGRDTPAAIVATFPVFAYGYAGVGLFFVLSGFCIHFPQARKFHARGSDGLDVREFARRRFWRLYPAYFASLVLAILGLGAMNLTCHPPEFGGYSRDYLVGAFGLSLVLPNTVFALPLEPDAQLLCPVAWTLLYEIQFYLLYPLLLKVVRTTGFAPVAAVLLVCELAFATVPTPESLVPLKPRFEFLFLRRYFDWFLGMWLAERLAAGNPLPVAWAKRLLVVGVVGGPLASAFPLTWSLHELFFVVASAGLVAWAVANPPARPNLATRLLAPVGERSYSLYLIHMSVMRLVVAGFACLPDAWHGVSTAVAIGLSCAVAVPAAAWGWHRLFEKPYLPTPAAAKAHQPSFA